MLGCVLKWVKGLGLGETCWDCVKGQQKRNVPAPDPNSDMLHPLACQMVRDWCGPHHVSGLDGELYWLLAVCPRGEHWVATATKKTEFIIIIDKLLRHIRGLVGDDLVRFVKFDGAPSQRLFSVRGNDANVLKCFDGAILASFALSVCANRGSQFSILTVLRSIHRLKLHWFIFGDVLPSAFYMAFEIDLPLGLDPKQAWFQRHVKSGQHVTMHEILLRWLKTSTSPFPPRMG